MLGVLDYMEFEWEVRLRRIGCTGLSRLNLWRKVLSDMPQLQQRLAQPSVFDSSTLPRPVTDLSGATSRSISAVPCTVCARRSGSLLS